METNKKQTRRKRRQDHGMDKVEFERRQLWQGKTFLDTLENSNLNISYYI
jgi:hypothetical protein